MKMLMAALVLVQFGLPFTVARGAVGEAPVVVETVDEVLERWVKLTSFRFDVAYRSRQLYRPVNQHTLAGDLGINHSSIARIASGIQPLSLRIGSAVAKALGVPIDWLMGFDFLKDEFRTYDQRSLAVLRKAKIRSAETLVTVALSAKDVVVDPRLPLGCELAMISTEAFANELWKRGYSLRKRADGD